MEEAPPRMLRLGLRYASTYERVGGGELHLVYKEKRDREWPKVRKVRLGVGTDSGGADSVYPGSVVSVCL